MNEIERNRKIEEQVKIMNAYLNGKTIQFRVRNKKDDDWNDALCPSWDWYDVDYRIKPDEAEESKKLMTYRQLSELITKGYGQWLYNYDNAVMGKNTLFIDKEVNENILIRPWGLDKLVRPTVDIYEEFMKRKAEEDTIKDYSDASKVEPKVGEVFKYKGHTLKCVEGDSCKDCAFCKIDCFLTECRQSKRSDGKMVFFVDVSKMENTTASEDSSATVSKEESVGVHRRTPQEFADFFNCYVAMDKDGEWYLYSEEPRFGSYSWNSSKGLFRHMDSLGFLSFIIVTENHNWRTLYRPHQEPIVNEEEEDD